MLLLELMSRLAEGTHCLAPPEYCDQGYESQPFSCICRCIEIINQGKVFVVPELNLNLNSPEDPHRAAE